MDSVRNQNILEQIYMQCRYTGVPCSSQETVSFLIDICDRYDISRYMEIGVAYGYSLLSIAQHIYTRGGYVVGREINPRSYAYAQQALDILDISDTHIYCGDFLQTDLSIYTQDRSPQLIYIDARKSDYIAYISYISDIIQEDTIVVLDDVIKYSYKIGDLRKYVESQGYIAETHQLDIDDGVMLCYKNHGKSDKQ